MSNLLYWTHTRMSVEESVHLAYLDEPNALCGRPVTTPANPTHELCTPCRWELHNIDGPTMKWEADK